MPISLSFIPNAVNLIACSCFMMLGSQQLNMNPSSSSFIFCIGVFSLARLLLVCITGDMPSEACHRLALSVYECKNEWTTNELMHYRAIKRFRRDFRVVMLRVVHIRQSSILAVLAFVLNYCVILLQTENSKTLNEMFNDTKVVNESSV